MSKREKGGFLSTSHKPCFLKRKKKVLKGFFCDPYSGTSVFKGLHKILWLCLAEEEETKQSNKLFPIIWGKGFLNPNIISATYSYLWQEALSHACNCGASGPVTWICSQRLRGKSISTLTQISLQETFLPTSSAGVDGDIYYIHISWYFWVSMKLYVYLSVYWSPRTYFNPVDSTEEYWGHRSRQH